MKNIEYFKKDISKEFKSKINIIESFNNIIDLLIYYFLLKKKINHNDYIKNFFLIIQAFEGGKDACDCAKSFFQLFRTFLDKYIDNKYNIINISTTTRGNLKKIIFEINYLNLYYLLKLEHGINRIIRFSPFKKKSTVQTSFVKIIILPFIKTNNITLLKQDLLIESCRSTGAGGQHVNKTNSAVSILHKPTKIRVKIQSERSYHQNLIIAKRLLISKIIYNEKQKNQDILNDILKINSKKIIRSIFFTKQMIYDNILQEKFFGKKNINSFFNGEILNYIYKKIKK
jgi:protein subunit release factor B